MLGCSAWMLIVGYWVSVTFSYEELVVHGNCSGILDVEDFVVWGTPRLPLTCTLYGTERCEDIPPTHLVDDIPATELTSMWVHGTLVEDPKSNSSPQMIIEWEISETTESGSGSVQIRAFRLEIRIYDSTDNSSKLVCRTFHFLDSLSNVSGTKKKLVGFSGGSHLLYKADLTSLPRHSPVAKLTKFFTLQPVQKGTVIPASNWNPFISYDKVNFTAPATIEARFSLAASTYGFRQYRVMLESKNDSLNAVETCIISITSSYFCQGMEYDPPSQNETTALASFSDIAAGQYVIHIQPVDPYNQDDVRCVCYSLFTNEVRLCQPCLDTSSTVFTVASETTSPLANATSTPVMNRTSSFVENATSTPTMNSTVSPLPNETSASTINTTVSPLPNETSMSSMNTTTSPVANETSTPTINTTTSPVENATSTPTISTTTSPVTNTTSLPMINTTTSPEENETNTPTINTTTSPVENATSTPTISTTTSPVTNTTSLPMINTTTSPVENETKTPTINTTTTPVANETNTPTMNTTTSPVTNATSAPTMNTTTSPMTNSTSAPLVTTTSPPMMSTANTPVLTATTTTAIGPVVKPVPSTAGKQIQVQRSTQPLLFHLWSLYALSKIYL